MEKVQSSYPRNVEEFRIFFSSDEACFLYLICRRWPNGFQCSGCGCNNYWRTKRNILLCQNCRKPNYLTAETLMHGSHVPLRKWFWCAYIVSTLTPGISALQLQRQLGLGSYRAAWYLLGRLRKGMLNDARSKLSGIIEADETIVGGPVVGKRGRGTTTDKNKSLVIGAVEVVSYVDKKGNIKERAGRIRFETVQRADEETISSFLDKNIEIGSTIRTDGWRGYSTTALARYMHEVYIQQGASKRSHQHAPHIHRAFSNLKTWLTGTHHGVNPKYLQGYLDEYVFRFNRRQNPMAAFETLLGIAMSKEPLPLKQLKVAPNA